MFPRAVVCLSVVLLLLGATAAAGQEMDPAYRFRTIRTEHFRIHFHGRATELASLLPAIAEATWSRFAAMPGLPPPAMTDVVLVDQSDSPNGYATPLPRNRIVLYAVAPAPAGLLNPIRWLETLFVHEFTHIVQLDLARGWSRFARSVVGRAPWTFPNLLLPVWQIEGLATFHESRDGAAKGGIAAGRLHSGDFLVLTGEAARAGHLEPLDRVGSGLSDWPGGLAPYAYGSTFHAYLADRFGDEALGALATRTARALPWFGTRAFRDVFGSDVGTLWRNYTTALTATAAASPTAPVDQARRVTGHGFSVVGPRYLPPPCVSCSAPIAYSARTPDEHPGIYRIESGADSPVRLTTRFGGTTMAPAPDGRIYFDQQERVRNTGLYSDLHVLEPDGTVRRLTREARLMAPDLAPDGRTLVAVRHAAAGRRDLVTIELTREGSVDLSSLVTIASGEGVAFDAPRWSPDGRRIAATRQGPTGVPQLVVLERKGGSVVAVAPDTTVRWATPTWRPDGSALIAAAAAGDTPFNLHEVTLGTGVMRRLTSRPAGAMWPDMSPDGSTIAFIGYTTDGFDVFEIDYFSNAAPDPAAGFAGPVIGSEGPATPISLPTSRPYRPWPTLLPTSWTPIVTASDAQVRAGAAVAGRDVLGYHTWSAAATWRIIDRVEAELPAAVDWNASYLYGRRQQQFWTSLARSTTFITRRADESSPAVPIPVTEQALETGVSWPVYRLGSSQTTRFSLVRSIDTWHDRGRLIERNRSALRGSWRFTSARRPGYAISPEHGVTVGAASDVTLPAIGADGRATAASLDLRLYLPGVRHHHVVAIRTAGAFTWGDDAVRRVFLLGGAAASPHAGNLSSDGTALLRGFGAQTFAGRHVALVNIDYRFPIARPQRGLGAWPLFLHSIHGALVSDTGHAWTRRFNRSHLKTSLGIELSADLVLGYGLPVTITGGVAGGHDGAGVARDEVTAYARVGYAF